MKKIIKTITIIELGEEDLKYKAFPIAEKIKDLRFKIDLNDFYITKTDIEKSDKIVFYNGFGSILLKDRGL